VTAVSGGFRTLRAEPSERGPVAAGRAAGRRLVRDKFAFLSALWLLFATIAALAAPSVSAFITHSEPFATDLTQRFLGPGEGHLLGTDQLGRDTLTRLVYGARVSLGVGFLTVLLQLMIGGAVGLVAGYARGWIDLVLMRLVDVILAFPQLFLFVLMAIIFKPGAATLSLMLASVGWVGVARLVRAEVLSLRTREFVAASRAVGATSTRIILKDLLPNAAPTMIVSASLGLGNILLAAAGLDFLGLGVQPPTPSWGNMLTSAQTQLYHSAWLVILPGTTIAITVLAANILGDFTRDMLDPRVTRR